MAFFFDYIKRLEISQLNKDQAKQCLFYINCFGLENDRIKDESFPIREQVIKRLEQLYEEDNQTQ